MSQKNDYIEVLLNNPVKYIGHREPLYKVDSEVLLLLALMLHPDPANRPTIEECIEVMRTACFSEEQKALNKQKSPNLSSTDSKLMRKADGYFADPGPVQMQRFESWDGCSPMASNLFESPSSHAIVDYANSPLISLANWRAGKLKLSKHTAFSSKGSKLIQGQGSLIRSNSRSSVGVRSNESSSNQFSALDRKNSPPKPEFSRDRVCNPKIRPLLLDKREALRIKGTPKANQSPSLRYIKERVGFMGDIDPIPQGVTITKPKSNFAEYCKKFSLKKERNFSFKKDQTDTSVSILCLDEVPNGDPSNLEEEEIETHIPALSVLVKKLLPKPQWKPTCKLLTHLQRGMNLESTINPSPRLSCARLRTTEDIVPFPED